MKQGWIGVVAGLAIGFTAVFVGQHGGSSNAPASHPDGKATAELVTRCHVPLKPAYERGTAAIRSAITTQPARAIDAANALANIIDIRLDVCRKALSLREAEKRTGSAGSDIARDIAGLEPVVVKLSTVRARIEELTAALSSPQASDGPRKLDAVDAEMHDVP